MSNSHDQGERFLFGGVAEELGVGEVVVAAVGVGVGVGADVMLGLGAGTVCDGCGFLTTFRGVCLFELGVDGWVRPSDSLCGVGATPERT